MNAIENKGDSSRLKNNKVRSSLFISHISIPNPSFQDRYDQIRPIMRIWRHLKMTKRSGRAHDPDGIAATALGDCAVECPACPHPDRNLPEGWNNAPPTER